MSDSPHRSLTRRDAPGYSPDNHGQTPSSSRASQGPPRTTSPSPSGPQPPSLMVNNRPKRTIKPPRQFDDTPPTPPRPKTNGPPRQPYKKCGRCNKWLPKQRFLKPEGSAFATCGACRANMRSYHASQSARSATQSSTVNVDADARVTVSSPALPSALAPSQPSPPSLSPSQTSTTSTEASDTNDRGGA